MKGNSRVYWLVAFALLLGLTTTANAAWQPFGLTYNVSAYPIGKSDSGVFWQAQSFNFTDSVRIVSGLQVFVENVYATSHVNQLYIAVYAGTNAGGPTALVSASAYGVNTTPVTDASWNNVTLVSPVVLYGGTPYFIVVGDNASTATTKMTDLWGESGGANNSRACTSVNGVVGGGPGGWSCNFGVNLTIAYTYNYTNTTNISITTPANTTYYNAGVPYAFEYQNTIIGEAPGYGEFQECGYWIDNNLNWLGNQTNSTPITGTLSVANGVHNFTAFCENATGGNTTGTNWFTVSDEPMNFTWVGGKPCPAGYETAANLSFYDEESVNLTVNSSMDATFTFYNATHENSFNVTVNTTNTAFILLCFVNYSQQYYMDSFQAFQGTNPTEYNQRNWFITNASITPITQVNVSLFNANATTTKNTKITFKDQNGLKISGAFITAQRYYPGSNSYLGVAMVRTDNAGEAVTYLVPNTEFYRFVAVENYVLTATFTSQQIVCDPGLTQCVVTLQKGGGELPGYWQYYDQITSNCGFIHATNISYCTFTDASGTFNYYEYRVLKLGIKNHEVICKVNTTASSGTLTCNTTGHGYGEYTGSLIGHGSMNLIAGHDFVNGGLTSLFGTSVAFLAVLLVPTIIFAVAASPAAALLFAGAAVLISAMVGLLVIDATTIAALVIIGLLVAWKVKQ